jgi:hypothetical protein
MLSISRFSASASSLAKGRLRKMEMRLLSCEKASQVRAVTFLVTESYGNGNDSEARIRDPDNVVKIRMFQAREDVL